MLIAGHRVRAHITVDDARGVHLLAHQTLHTAHIGQRGMRRVDDRLDGLQDLGHRYKRIAQHEHIRLGLHKFFEGVFAIDAGASRGLVRVCAVVPCADLAACGAQTHRERTADESETDDAYMLWAFDAVGGDRRQGGCDFNRGRRRWRGGVCFYHSSSFLMDASPCHASCKVPALHRTPPCGSIHSSTGGCGRSWRG